ncbi:MAG: hypothetical protein ACKVQV_16550, partial [Bacteroidia bacterium]
MVKIATFAKPENFSKTIIQNHFFLPSSQTTKRSAKRADLLLQTITLLMKLNFQLLSGGTNTPQLVDEVSF